MSRNNFSVPESPAVATEGVDNALRESEIPVSDLANALASKSQRRRPAPAPARGVTKVRQAAPGGRKARNGQPVKRIGKACVDCRSSKMRCDGEHPSCGRCNGKGKGQSCRYECTTKEFAAMRADAESRRRRREAFEIASSAPQHRYLQPRPEGPVTALRELAAAPVSSPPSTLYTPNQGIDPNHFGETLGNWNARPIESSQYPQGAGLMFDGLEDRPDEALHDPQQYQLARTNYTQPQYGLSPYNTQLQYAQLPDNTQLQWEQLPYNTQPQWEQLPYNTQPLYGQLPYNGELDFAAGSSTDQFSDVSRYPSASNMLYDGAATWQDTYMPSQYQAGMGSLFDGLPAGSSYNAQSLAESSHHVELANNPAYIAAMMPPW